MDSNTEEYQTVVLVALLHDIGKFLGRGHSEVLDKGQSSATRLSKVVGSKAPVFALSTGEPAPGPPLAVSSGNRKQIASLSPEVPGGKNSLT